jgi:hypothetical protein
MSTNLLNANFTNADLSGCRIYGVSAWGLKLEGAKQQNLIVTQEDEPEITVDNIEVAQFIYLMLKNEKVRDVIDTITSKVVLILGRFTAERKTALDALREELRKRNYLPILFDFDVPATRDITETVSLLARMARFIIADLTVEGVIPRGQEPQVARLPCGSTRRRATPGPERVLTRRERGPPPLGERDELQARRHQLPRSGLGNLRRSRFDA